MEITFIYFGFPESNTLKYYFQRDVFVSILVPPFIDGADDVTDSTVIINSPLELECHATGTPAPLIT